VADRKYTASHEWLAREGDSATIGITDFAQAQLGDVVFLELPAKGAKLKVGESFGVIESVKAASDLYSPVSGEVAEVNADLKDHPEYVNEDPYGKGWVIKLRGVKDNPKLLDQRGYDAFVKGQAGS